MDRDTMLTALIVTFVFAAPLLMAAYTDFNEMKIPNKVTLAMFAGFFLTLPLHWQGVPVFLEHIGMFSVFFAAGFAMFAFGWLGGGDAKLMAATAIWFGWADATVYIFLVTIIGAVLALFLLISRRFVPVYFRTAVPVLGKLYQGGNDMPYGLALAAGALWLWPISEIGVTLNF